MLRRALPRFFYIAVVMVLSAAAYAQSDCPAGTGDQELVQHTEEALGRIATIAPELVVFYARCQNHLVWVAGAGMTAQAKQVLTSIGEASQYGLRREDYLLPQTLTGAEEANKAIAFDVLLTKAVLDFVHDLRCGRPERSQKGADIEDTCRDFDVAAFVWRLRNSSKVQQEIGELEPDAPGYRRTKSALLALSSMPPLDLLPPWRGDLMSSTPSMLPLLLAHLNAEGDVHLEGSGRSLSADEIASALRSFQRRHGLLQSGKLDLATHKAMSVPVSFRTQQLELTLERWRWISRSFADGPVVVNIPEFKLRAYDGQMNVRLTARVIVGRAYRRHTPVFQNVISAIDFRPYWNVPPSIQRNEIAPLVKKDPGYLAHHGFESLRSSNGTIRIRQKPGESNALGLIRFSLPNTHNVYLHDTPKRELFEAVRRDFSHGCIRVENPALLAEWLLQGQGSWTEDEILSSMHGDKTFSVRLARPRPILIVYGTGFAAEDGKLYFLTDIYAEDRELLSMLETLSAKRKIMNATLARVVGGW